uniref:Ankyrin repeat domain containing 50 n=1 Tax=Scleropages formosus TaxID=113540 RepID=A0A8C9U0F9_SCLFO
MAQTSLLQGKRFYCREWVFHKLQHCLQEKTSALSGTPGKQTGGASPGVASAKGSTWGVLLVGGPGSGKTALCTELLWPSSPQGAQRGLHRQVLAFHFCRAEDADTLCAGSFVRGLVAQIGRSSLLQGYEEKVREPAARGTLQPGECERNPAEAFKRCILLPLLAIPPPQQSLFILVDSIDEGCQAGEGEHRAAGSSRTIAELLASHHEFLPPWLLLICSARRQNKAVTKLFTGGVRAARQVREPRGLWRGPCSGAAVMDFQEGPSWGDCGMWRCSAGWGKSLTLLSSPHFFFVYTLHG